MTVREQCSAIYHNEVIRMKQHLAIETVMCDTRTLKGFLSFKTAMPNAELPDRVLKNYMR